MNVTYLGHSCVSVEVGGKILLFDPFIRPNPLAAGVDFAGIRADYIFLSHGHFDHVADAVDLAGQTGATVVAIFEIAEWMRKQGVEKTHPMNVGGSWEFEFGSAKLVPAVHSSVLHDGSYAGVAGGWVISTAGGAFYFAGDTALTAEMRLIGEGAELDFAILPIGGNFTMNAADAARACAMLGVTEVVGVHYDTFPWIVIDRARAQATFRDAGRNLHLIEIGGSLDL